MDRRTWFLTAIILGGTAVALFAMGRHPICTCGAVRLWVGQRDSPETSQMLADWYSLSHVVHGLLFFGALWLIARHLPVETRFLIALSLEACWEIIENTPLVIDRYRETTVALGYSGDSIINSLSDISMMMLGFVLARRLPAKAAVVLVLVLEVLPLFTIRDNLTLNVWQLIAPNKAVQAWQARH